MSQPEKYDLVVLGSRDVVSASIMYCDVVRLTKSGASAQREGRRIAPKLFGAMVHAKKIPMEERSQ
jgi:hypothetical protein